MATFRDGAELLLPEGSRVLHIGPHKTGTTSLQSAFHLCREAVTAQGVHYVGKGRHPMSAVLAAIGLASPTSDAKAPPPLRRWEEALEEMATATEPRIVLSSEFFADAKNAAIRSVVDQVGPEQVQVVVTLRPLAKILPSQWQQTVQSSSVTPFDEWLTTFFDDPKRLARFWRRHRHDELVARWASVVGPERVTAVVVDDSDHDSVLRSFEHLLGLVPGTLVADSSLVNRSLTLGESEAVRAYNIAFWADQLPRSLHARLIRSGAAHYLQERRPERGEDKVLMPQWALDRAAEVSDGIIEGLLAQDITITGDLELLRKQPVSRESVGQSGPATVSPEVAARLAMGITVAGGLVPPSVEEAARQVQAAKEAQARRAAVARQAKAKAEQARLAALSPPRRLAVRALGYVSRRARRAADRLKG